MEMLLISGSMFDFYIIKVMDSVKLIHYLYCFLLPGFIAIKPFDYSAVDTAGRS